MDRHGKIPITEVDHRATCIQKLRQLHLVCGGLRHMGEHLCTGAVAAQQLTAAGKGLLLLRGQVLPCCVIHAQDIAKPLLHSEGILLFQPLHFLALLLIIAALQPGLQAAVQKSLHDLVQGESFPQLCQRVDLLAIQGQFSIRLPLRLDQLFHGLQKTCAHTVRSNIRSDLHRDPPYLFL